MKLFSVAFFGLLLLVACSKKDLDGIFSEYKIAIASSSHQQGFGNNDGTPSGEIFNLPDNLELLQQPDHLFDPSLDKLHGHMNTFYADIHIINRSDCNSASTKLVLPKGLVFLNRSGARMQHGILIQDVELTIPPSACGRQDIFTAYIGLACINEAMGLPWGENTDDDVRNYPIAKDMYSIGVVSNDPNLNSLLNLFKDHNGLKLTRHYNPFDQFDEDYIEPEWKKIYGRIQQAIWDITDGPGLIQKDMDELKQQLKNYR